jgi:LPXTG-motif cell wall-anchored protein
MKKVLGLLVALVALAALPSVAFAQGNGGDRVEGPCQRGGDCEQENEIEGNVRGNVGQQNCIATGDCTQRIDQSRVTNIHRNVHGVGGGGDFDENNGDRFGVGGGHVTGVGGVGGGGVGGVTLARTGMDAWIFALIGGLAVAGGVGILAAQRRGRLNA